MIRRALMVVALAASLGAAGCGHVEKTAPCGPMAMAGAWSDCGAAVPVE